MDMASHFLNKSKWSIKYLYRFNASISSCINCSDSSIKSKRVRDPSIDDEFSFFKETKKTK